MLDGIQGNRLAIHHDELLVPDGGFEYRANHEAAAMKIIDTLNRVVIANDFERVGIISIDPERQLLFLVWQCIGVCGCEPIL